MRVVFDEFVKTSSGVSLSDILMTSPVLKMAFSLFLLHLLENIKLFLQQTL